MELKRVGILSGAKVLGLLYAALGLIFGGIFSFVSVLGAAAGSGRGGAGGLLFGVGAVIILPIFYGIVGFIGGALTAVLYNLIAHVAGGLELEFESRDSGNMPESSGGYNT